jgi:hypothetical protein
VTGVEVETLRADPWPHLLLDGFLPEAGLAASLEEIASENYEFDIEQRGLGRIEFSVLKSETLWRAIYSRRIVDLLARAFGVRVRLDKDNWLQLRRMNDDTPDFPIHSDFSDEDTIVSFLYLSEATAARGERRLGRRGGDRADPQPVHRLSDQGRTLALGGAGAWLGATEHPGAVEHRSRVN